MLATFLLVFGWLVFGSINAAFLAITDHEPWENADHDLVKMGFALGPLGTGMGLFCLLGMGIEWITRYPRKVIANGFINAWNRLAGVKSDARSK